jgi:hypothetical protein
MRIIIKGLQRAAGLVKRVSANNYNRLQLYGIKLVL